MPKTPTPAPPSAARRPQTLSLHGDDRVWISLVTMGDGLTLAMKK